MAPVLSGCRMRIMEALGDREMTGAQVADAVGRLHTNVVRDLRLLQLRGLVSQRKDHLDRRLIIYRAVHR